MSALLSIPSEQRQIEDQSNPVTVDEEKDGQEGLDGSFGDDVGVEAVAEVDRVDVVAVPEVSMYKDMYNE